MMVELRDLKQVLECAKRCTCLLLNLLFDRVTAAIFL